MKKYIVLVGLITSFLYSMKNESEFIDFNTEKINENSYLLINDRGTMQYPQDEKESSPHYIYHTTIKHTPRCIEDVAWHPTEKNRLFTITRKKLCMWNTQKNENPMVIVSSDENTEGFSCMAVSDNGSRVVCASYNKLFVWDSLEKQPLKSYTFGEYNNFFGSREVKRVIFIPRNNDKTVSMFEGKSMGGWKNKNVITFKNIENNESDVIYNQSGSCNDMVIHPLNTNLLMTAQRENTYHHTTFNIFDIEKKQLIYDISWNIFRIACNPTNPFGVATGAWLSPNINIWDLREKGLNVNKLKTTGYSCFENTGADIKFLSNGHDIVVTSENRTQIYDIRTDKRSQALDNEYSFFHALNCYGKVTGQHTQAITGIRIQPQDQQLLTYSCDELKIWKNKNN